MSVAEREQGDGAEHQVTPLELLFDLAFVFAFTQVTRLLVDDPTWGGVLRGMLVLAALWMAWSGYAWLTSTIDVDDGGVRLAMLASMGAMLGAALAVPGAFADDAVLFACAYLLVRVLHLVLYSIVARGDPDLRGSLLRLAPTELLGASLLVVAAFASEDARVLLWLAALAIDYFGPIVVGLGSGWRIAPEHFAERHGLIVLIALGESVISLGLGAGLELIPKVLATAALGVVVVSALWWLYFDVAAIFARSRLVLASGARAGAARLMARTPTSTCRWSRGSSSSPSGSRRRCTTSAIRSAACTRSRSAAGRGCTCSRTSGSSSARPAVSSGGGRSGRSCCSRSCRPRWPFPHSSRSRS